jgi:hypothetical protein
MSTSRKPSAHTAPESFPQCPATTPILKEGGTALFVGIKVAGVSGSVPFIKVGMAINSGEESPGVQAVNNVENRKAIPKTRKTKLIEVLNNEPVFVLGLSEDFSMRCLF